MDDTYILNIETSTKACSVSLNLNGNLISCEDIVGSGFSHSEKLLPFISQTIEKSKIKMYDLSAVAVSMGPGSFTGLRIGVSTAKGICYALDIPLIAVSTLQAMAFGMAKKIKSELFHIWKKARLMYDMISEEREVEDFIKNNITSAYEAIDESMRYIEYNEMFPSKDKEQENEEGRNNFLSNQDKRYPSLSITLFDKTNSQFD